MVAETSWAEAAFCCPTGVAGQLAALFHLAGARFHGPDRLGGAGLDVADQLGDLPSRGCRPLRQLAHLFRHHGETPSVLARPGGLDGGIQRQQVGLFGDAGDHLGDLADLRGELLQVPDALRRLQDHVADPLHPDHALVDDAGPGLGDARRLGGAVGHFGGAVGHGLQRADHLGEHLGGALDLGRRLLGAAGQLLNRLLQLLDGRAYLVRGLGLLRGARGHLAHSLGGAPGALGGLAGGGRELLGGGEDRLGGAGGPEFDSCGPDLGTWGDRTVALMRVCGIGYSEMARFS